MSLSVIKLIQSMNELYPQDPIKQIVCSDANARVISIKMLLEPVTRAQSDILYICKDVDTIPNTDPELLINCVLLKDLPSEYDAPDHLNLFVLISSDLQAANRVAGRLSNIITSEIRFLSDAHQMIREISSRSRVGAVLDIVSGYIPFPIFIMDSSFRLIAMTGQDDVDDVIWKDLKQFGSFSYDNFIRSKIEKRFEKMVTSRKLLYVNASDEPPAIAHDNVDYEVLPLHKTSLKISRLIVNLQLQNQTMAHISILETGGRFTEYHLRMAEVFKTYLNGTMQLNAEFRSIRSKADSFVYDLLNNVTMSDEFFNARKQISNWKDADGYYVLSIGSSTSGRKDLLPVHGIFQGLIPNGRSIIHEDRLVFLIGTNTGRWNTQERIQKICSVLKDNNMYGGLSYSFSDLRKAPLAMEQAICTAELVESTNPRELLGSFADFVPLYVLREGPRKIPLGDAVHPSLRILSDYDREKDADLLITLRTFISSMNSYSQTAEVLNVHRNTLDYRIKRISEMTGLDLSDEKTVRNLFVSFDILYMLGEL